MGAIILCSGGLDSVVTAHYVKKILNHKLKVLFFDYGQRNLIYEKKAAKRCAEDLDCEFFEIKINELKNFSNSYLHKKIIPNMGRDKLKNTKKESRKWYFPYRNLIFLSYALSLAEALELKNKGRYKIFVGFKNEGKEHYPDTTSDFLNSLNKISARFYKKIEIFAPLIKMDKEDIILLGKKMNISLENTYSCYVGEKIHCGKCLACRLRKTGFYWANLKDPTVYTTP